MTKRNDWTERDRPTVSVVLPVHNGAAFLKEAVDSILQQTAPDFELILIDDGSTDATHDLAQELCAADARIRYVRQDNRGITATLNRGLELCRGDFIARMDADDVAHPQRLEKQLALLRREPDVVICGTAVRLIGEASGLQRKPRSDRACRAWQLLLPCFVHPTVVFRRCVVDDGLRYRDEYLHAEDYDFWFRVGELGKMRNIGEPLLSYRIHSGQVTSSKRAVQRRTHIDIAAAHLARTGIRIDPAHLHDVLWPELSARSRWSILLSAGWLYLRMALAGRSSPGLMAGMAWHIVRHQRA